MARKARKHKQQGGRLALPALEFAYLFLGIAHAPHSVITSRMLPLVEQQLAALHMFADDPAKYGTGSADSLPLEEREGEFWDDLCLANFLKGICLRFVAYPDSDAVIDKEEEKSVLEGRSEAEQGAKEAFEAVFRDGRSIVYDHYLVYYARKWLSCSVSRSVSRAYRWSVCGKDGLGANGCALQISSMRVCWRARAIRMARARI